MTDPAAQTESPPPTPTNLAYEQGWRDALAALDGYIDPADARLAVRIAELLRKPLEQRD